MAIVELSLFQKQESGRSFDPAESRAARAWRFHLQNVGLHYAVTSSRGHLFLRGYSIGSRHKGCHLQGRVDFNSPSFLAAFFLMWSPVRVLVSQCPSVCLGCLECLRFSLCFLFGRWTVLLCIPSFSVGELVDAQSVFLFHSLRFLFEYLHRGLLFIMQYLQPSHLYTRLIDTIPTSIPLPWSSDPAVKGDPKKSVKWIDVCFSFFQNRQCIWLQSNIDSTSRASEESPHS